jgi:predicted phosphodiesterase
MTGPVLYCGDTHGQFRHVIKAARELSASAVVLLGDLEPRRPLHEELAPILDKVWLIHGNHDTDSSANWSNVWESKLADRNVDGRVVTLPNGTRLAGLGGIFRGTVWYPTPTGDRGGAPAFRSRDEHASQQDPRHHWQGSVNRTHWSSIYPDDFDRLADLQADVLITHEAPGYHQRGFDLLDTLAQAMGVKVTVHGHHHDRLDSSDRWAKQGFKSYGVGLRGITAIDVDGSAEVIVPGELDEARNFRQHYLDVFKHIMDESSQDGSEPPKPSGVEP